MIQICLIISQFICGSLKNTVNEDEMIRVDWVLSVIKYEPASLGSLKTLMPTFYHLLVYKEISLNNSGFPTL